MNWRYPARVVERIKPHYGTVLAAAGERKPEARGDLLELAAARLRPAIVRAMALGSGRPALR